MASAYRWADQDELDRAILVCSRLSTPSGTVTTRAERQSYRPEWPASDHFNPPGPPLNALNNGAF